MSYLMKTIFLFQIQMHLSLHAIIFLYTSDTPFPSHIFQPKSPLPMNEFSSPNQASTTRATPLTDQSPIIMTTYIPTLPLTPQTKTSPPQLTTMSTTASPHQILYIIPI